MEPTKTPPEDLRQLNRWQNKLLPWMVIMPTLLIGLFIYLSTRQLDEFKASINSYRSETAIGSLPAPGDTSRRFASIPNNLDYIKWYSRVKMEERALDHRYAQTGFLLIARTYSKYLGFFTGMVLAIVAAVFIISKLREDISKLGGTVSENLKFRVVSSSPGVIFGILGTTLMMATILYNPEIGQTDTPLYVTPEITIQTTGQSLNNPAIQKGKIPVNEILNLGKDSANIKNDPNH